MSALDVLRQIKQARRAQGANQVIEWGIGHFYQNNWLQILITVVFFFFLSFALS